MESFLEFDKKSLFIFLFFVGFILVLIGGVFRLCSGLRISALFFDQLTLTERSRRKIGYKLQFIGFAILILLGFYVFYPQIKSHLG
jgi:hypothetical protein